MLAVSEVVVRSGAGAAFTCWLPHIVYVVRTAVVGTSVFPVLDLLHRVSESKPSKLLYSRFTRGRVSRQE